VKVRRWIPPITWAGVILAVSSVPNPELPAIVPHYSDKLLHVAAYAVLAWLSTRAASAPVRASLRTAAISIAVLAFGAFDEWHQQFVPGRRPDLQDWIADGAGALLGTTLAAGTLRRERCA
jgi:VanZ family protein